MKAFALISEEAISKGIRRIVAITGPDAERVSDILLTTYSNMRYVLQSRFHQLTFVYA